MGNKKMIFVVIYSFRPQKLFWRKLLRIRGWKLLDSYGHIPFQVIAKRNVCTVPNLKKICRNCDF